MLDLEARLVILFGIGVLGFSVQDLEAIGTEDLDNK